MFWPGLSKCRTHTRKLGRGEIRKFSLIRLTMRKSEAVQTKTRAKTQAKKGGKPSGDKLTKDHSRGRTLRTQELMRKQGTRETN